MDFRFRQFGTDVSRAEFGQTVRIGAVATEHISASSAGITLKDGSTVLANFASTTTIGSTSGEHVSISSTAVEIKTDANTTALSASAAGLEMSGKVKATSGEIGGFLISQNEISSSLTPKRGLVLKPGDSIKGYGNTVHTTETVQGKFSFGVATVAPPVDAPQSQRFSTDYLSADAPGGGQIAT